MQLPERLPKSRDIKSNPDIDGITRCLEIIMKNRGMTVKVRERGKT